MSINLNTMIQTYKWRNDKNILPFNWKCQLCGTITQIIKVDTNTVTECSNPDCSIKLKFVLHTL